MSNIQLKIADLSDMDDVLALHSKYQVDSITAEDRKDGFITTAFSKDQLTRLVAEEKGLFIARNNGAVAAYVMAASWRYWAAWPMFRFMAEGLSSLQYAGLRLSAENSYQYGPVCLDKSVRGSGLLEKIFNFSKCEMSHRFDVLVTFINKNNSRSYQAHVRKLGLDVIDEFEFNGNEYYEMACLTKS